MNWPATIANSLWFGSSLPAWVNFRRALNQPAEVQRNLLRHLLACNSECAYGRAHGFGEIKSYEDFTRRVPIVNYENVAPWVDRIRGGELRVLTNERVTHLIPTSGSTGARKLIPFTAGLQHEFNRAISPWIADLARQHSKILFGPAYWSITPAQRSAGVEPSAVPIGFADDASYLGGAKGWLVRAAMAVPNEISSTVDIEDFRFRTLLCLLRKRDLRLISVWHPSFLTLLMDALPNYWDKILAELSRENSHHARELEHADPHQPASLWPHLSVISCWGDGHASLSLADLHRRLPNVFVQAKGLLATEAFVTIPFGGCHPVAVRSHLFEFIDEQGQVHLAHELRKHETYEVVVTTAGGLWRYRMGDQIQVAGFLGKTPSLRFIGRNGNVSDLFGEKLSEAFVAKAIQETLVGFSAKPRFVLLAPDEDVAGSRYTLYVEGAVPSNLAEALDHALRQNPNYTHCRDLGQLQSVRVFNIAERGYEIFASRLVSEGKRLGDIKPISLCNSMGWSETFSRV
jgi:GH3 auxin-responsive promoter